MSIVKSIKALIKTNEDIAQILNHLKDGRAYTLIELSNTSGLPRDRTREVLSNLLMVRILQSRGDRNRTYYYIDNPEILSVLENEFPTEASQVRHLPKGIKYSRHCYKHLAGYAGVAITEALVEKGYLQATGNSFKVTDSGKDWFLSMGIPSSLFSYDGERLSKECLDFSERKSHLAGKLGDALLSRFLDLNWMKQVPDSREIKILPLGKKKIQEDLGIIL